MSHALKMTTVISLLQPPPEVFTLFDDLMFLCEGRMLYHGPLEGAVPHFTASGFICPVRKDVASFLLEITTPTGEAPRQQALDPCFAHSCTRSCFLSSSRGPRRPANFGRLCN